MNDKNIDFTSDDAFNTLTSSSVVSSTTDVESNNMIRGRKRIAERNIYGEPSAKKLTPSIRVGPGFKWNLQALVLAADAVHTKGKSPVSALNELGVKVTYKILREGGPAHCPIFTVSVTVADMSFEGWGHSKREARASAAKTCLEALLTHAGRVLTTVPVHQDFTADALPVSEFRESGNQWSGNHVRPSNDTRSCTAGVVPSTAQGSTLFGNTASSISKSPINILYENYPGLTFDCTFGDGSSLDYSEAPLQLAHSMRFKVVCYINGQKFEGYGSSKKLAKLAAARSALAVLETGRSEVQHHSNGHTSYLAQTLADHIGNLVNEKFSELTRNDALRSKRKVLAGIVMTTDNRIDGAKLIAVTTGTKCVSGEYMSVRGRAVNDCHAEVAARRCLQRHLYSQLLMYASQHNPRVPIPESDLEPAPGGGYQLRPNRQIHLYVSTAPCGDGRIFSPHEQLEPEPDKHPNRLARGQLRTKLESGEGTIPVKSSMGIQTWDGVLQGERLLTMSCSDKVARWCVVGLQGALLSRMLRPVYLSSIVLGSLLHPHHLYRAICGRIERYISSLPPPFRLQRPMLARAASTEARTPAKAPSFSVCWCSTTPVALEVLNATTGKLENGQPSLMCKQSMFARWHYLLKRLPQTAQVPDLEQHPPAPLPDNMDTILYSEAKLLCKTYQEAKIQLFGAFEKAKLGRWVKKPLEQDQFVCELLDAKESALFA